MEKEILNKARIIESDIIEFESFLNVSKNKFSITLHYSDESGLNGFDSRIDKKFNDLFREFFKQQIQRLESELKEL